MGTDEAVNALTGVAVVGITAGMTMNIMDRTLGTNTTRKKKLKKQSKGNSLKPINFGNLYKV